MRLVGRKDIARSGILLLILWIGVVAEASNYASLKSHAQPTTVPELGVLPSWNPAVSCGAVLLTEEQFVGTVPNPTQPFPGTSSKAIGADYSGGVLRLAGNLPAGSNPTTWPYPKRSTNPPCQVTLSNGTAVPTFVEIHNVVVGEVDLAECGALFPGQCDRSFNVCDYTASQCLQQDQSLTTNNYNTTMFQHHNEIDMVWNNSGLIPASQQQIQQGMKVDLQGFVFWDPDHLDKSYHSFSGWELHPLTAWRPTGSPSVIVTSSPSPAMVGQTIAFTGNIAGGTSPYGGISWIFGDGTSSSCLTGSGQSCTIQHTYSARGNYTLTASTADSKGNTGAQTLAITVLPFGPSFSWSPTNPAVGQVVSFNGTATSGSPPYSFSWDFGDGDTATGPIVSHVYVQSQFFLVRLSVTDAIGNTGVKQRSIAVGSWNPKVNCSPIIVRITDITNNMTGSASLSNSIFNPGITSPTGAAKRWLTPGNAPSGWVSPGPPCTVTNSHGTISVFVEIDGVKRSSISTEDCVASYDKVNGGTSNGGTCAGGSGTNCGSYCDSTFNSYDPATVPNYSTSCTSATDPTCYGRIHTEIDHDWKAAHYCGAATTCDNSTLATQTASTSTVLDIQGFVFWDPGNLNQDWHSFNGWEIHPLTAWRIHRAPLTVSVSASSTTPAPGQGDTFTATASGGTAPYTYTWDFGDGTTTTGTVSQLVHVYGSAGTRIIHLYAVDSLGASGVASKTITVVSPLAASFTYTTPAMAGSPVTFNATATGGLTPYSFNWSFGDNSAAIGTSPVHTYALAGTYTVKLTVTDSNGSNGTSTQSLSVTSTLAANFTYTQPLVTGQPSTFTAAATGGTSPYSYAWDFGDGILSMGNPVAHQYSVQGSYLVRLTVQDSAGHSSSATNTVSVSQSDFNISANPSSLTMLAGASSGSTITLTSVNSFSGTILLSASSSASGLSLSFNPASVSLSASGTNSSTLSISSSNVGSYTVTVNATSGSLSHMVSISVNVVDFTINASPTGENVNAGDNGTSTITVAPVNGFTGTVTLTSLVSPAGLTCTLSPTSIVLGASQNSTLSCSGPAGEYNVTVTGTSGSISHSATDTYTIQDFSVAASPTSITVNAGTTANSTITVAPLVGFNGTVSLGISSLPAGLFCGLTSSSIVLGPSQTSTLSCTGPAGTYAVTVTGTSGSLSRSATVTITIQDFTTGGGGIGRILDL
jgi:PKD repeat protein